MSQRMLVWDIPTRVFHWLLAVSFAGAFLTAESERYRDIHLVFGYTLLGLIFFRLLWGLVGSRYARFNSFLFKPVEIATYLRSLFKARPEYYVGHNPAGSVAVYLLLALGVASGATGVTLLRDTGGEVLEELHEMVSYTMLIVVTLHVAGVLASSVLHRENLVRSMITGFKRFRPDEGIRRTHAWLGVIILTTVVAFWVGYPATGLVQPNSGMTQTGHQHDDDD
jgi:cytochrome b